MHDDPQYIGRSVANIEIQLAALTELVQELIRQSPQPLLLSKPRSEWISLREAARRSDGLYSRHWLARQIDQAELDGERALLKKNMDYSVKPSTRTGYMVRKLHWPICLDALNRLTEKEV